MACTEACWTPAACPDHGDEMQPLGRSAPLGAHQCCDNYQRGKVNPRHLWSEHDEVRQFHDPEGWAAHKAVCDQWPCKDDDEGGE